LIIGSALILPVDQEYIKLKVVASASNGTNYYKVKVILDTLEETAPTQIDVNIETLDSSIWTAFQTLNI
jgi:hypothetical protein